MHWNFRGIFFKTFVLLFVKAFLKLELYNLSSMRWISYIYIRTYLKLKWEIKDKYINNSVTLAMAEQQYSKNNSFYLYKNNM